MVLAKKMEKTLLEAGRKALALLMESPVVAGINPSLDSCRERGQDVHGDIF